MALPPLLARSFQRSTPGLGAALASALSTPRAPAAPPPSAYAGFDPTAPSLHLGHAAVLLTLVRLQRAGLRPIALLGGATALVGDPTGRSVDRPALPEATVRGNAARIRACLARVMHVEERVVSSAAEGAAADAAAAAARPHAIATLAGVTRLGGGSGDVPMRVLLPDACAVDVAGDGPAPSPSPRLACHLVDNASFYASMSALDLLRDVGVHFRLGQLLARDSVRGRMGWEGASGRAAAAALVGADVGEGGGGEAEGTSGGMSYSEFSYALLQAHDFYVLAESAGAMLQVGGSDQWGNITAGCDYVRRRRGCGGSGNAPSPPPLVHGATVPLLCDAAGRKFGKSAGNVPVWLDEGLTSHHTLWQHLLAVGDAQVRPLLHALTLESEESIADALDASQRAPEGKAAQLLLADAAVTLLRGAPAVASARRTALLLYGGTGLWGGCGGWEGGDAPSTPLPSHCLPQRALIHTLSAHDLFALACSGGVAGEGAAAGGDGAVDGAPPSSAIPLVRLPPSSIDGATVVDVALACGLVGSKADAKRALAGGGLYWNWERVSPREGSWRGDGGDSPLRRVARNKDLIGGAAAVVAIGKGSKQRMVVVGVRDE